MIGKKNDQGKIQPSILFRSFGYQIAELIKVLTYGAIKYGYDNWRYVPDAVQRYEDAAYRHLLAYSRGEEVDRESGMNHLAHCVTNLLFIMNLKRGANAVKHNVCPETQSREGDVPVLPAGETRWGGDGVLYGPGYNESIQQIATRKEETISENSRELDPRIRVTVAGKLHDWGGTGS